MAESLRQNVNEISSDEEMLYAPGEDEMPGGNNRRNNRPEIAQHADEVYIVDESGEESPNDYDQQPDSGEEDEMPDGDNRRNNRHDMAGDGDEVYIVNESGEASSNDHDVYSSGEETNDDEMLVPDSEESVGEEEREIDDSDEDAIPVSDEDDEPQLHFNHFENFFHVNVAGRGLEDLLLAQGNVQKFEKLLLEIAKALRFKHTYVSMLASFKIANIEFDNADFPTEMRTFWKLLNRNLDHFQRSIACTICWENLGAGKQPNRVCRCGETGPGKTKQIGTYLYLNLSAQLQGLLAKPGMARDLEYPWTRIKRNPDAIEDVYDGSVYQRLSADGGFLCRGSHNYSLAIWTDGVDPVISAPVTIWPVFVQVLELSPRARQRNSLLAALYVGPRKPQMAKFLSPVATELCNLYLNGINWHPEEAAEVRSRFITFIVAADSEARYEIMGMMRLNASHGCTYCYARGERIGERNQFHIYRYRDGDPDRDEDFAADRTDAEIRRNAEMASINNAPVNGVRTHSALSIIPGLDLRICQLVEALHCLWERNMTRLYSILTSPATQDHITEASIRTISNRIELVKPPTKLARGPRPLEYFAKYKGTEYRNLAWYYWLPCAHDFMTPEQIEHFSLFAEATYVLNKDSIHPAELEHAIHNLNRFREQSENMFANRYLTYSLHLLKHIVRSVQEIGPLWVASGFWFESMNRQVRNYITSPTDRAMQIACRILLAQMIEKCLDLQLSPAVLNLLREFLHKAKWITPPENATGRFIRYARAVPGLLEQQEIAALIEAGYQGIEEDMQITRHQKVCIDGVMYQPKGDKPLKYDNSVVHVNPPDDATEFEFIRIVSIIKWQNGVERMKGVIGHPFLTVRAAFNTTYMRIVQETQNLVYLPLKSINSPAVLVESLGTIYVSPVPNRWDVD